MFIYTCPECGHDLMSEVLTCIPPIHKDYCPNCGWSHSSREEVVRVPFVEGLMVKDITLEDIEDKVVKTINYSSGVVITGNLSKLNLDEY